MTTKSAPVWLEDVEQYAKELRLPMLRQHAAEYVFEANMKETEYGLFLTEILQKECDARQESARLNRVRGAEFSHKKYLEDLSVSDLPEDAQKKLKTLKTLDFIREGRNVILAGNPGTGKTHMAIGLGMKACLEGFKVWFTTVPLLLLVNLIKETRSEQRLRSFQNRFEKYDLVIADEMGYISFDREGAELLFTHLSLRAGHKSTIITTNLSFERWGEIFQDEVMTAAMIDRLTHQSHIVNMNGSSYRMKETEEWLQTQQSMS